jgi:hypothetical protein
MFKNNPPKRVEVNPFLAAMKGPDGRIIVHLTTDGVAQPAGVGILLVDIARHYARMFKQTGRATSEAAALEEIRKLFDAECGSPTDLGEGGIPN